MPIGKGYTFNREACMAGKCFVDSNVWIYSFVGNEI